MELFELRQRGVISIIYSTKGDDPTFGRNSAIYVTEAFEQAHPVSPCLWEREYFWRNFSDRVCR